MKKKFAIEYFDAANKSKEDRKRKKERKIRNQKKASG